MKKLVLTMMAALTLLASCKKENIEVIPQEALPENETVELCIQAGCQDGRSTKSIGDNWNYEDIKSLSVYIFNEDGSLDVAEKVLNSPSISLRCAVGNNKSIYAVANTDLISLTTESEIKKCTSNLISNSSGKVIMAGVLKNQTISSESKTFTIPIERSLTKVTIGSIENNLKDLALSRMTFKIKAIYLTNVAGDFPLFPSVYPNFSTEWTTDYWWNKKKWVKDVQSDPYLYDPISSSKETVLHHKTYTESHTFYAYPNPLKGLDKDSHKGEWSPRLTRLVIEVSIGGTTYYYPTTFENFESNHHYKINKITIEHKGSTDPDVEVPKNAATFEMEIVPWTETTLPDVII